MARFRLSPQAMHDILYRINDDRTVEIGRVLHDSVDLERHLPEVYAS